MPSLHELNEVTCNGDIAYFIDKTTQWMFIVSGIKRSALEVV
jgi:hypothetical protein